MSSILIKLVKELLNKVLFIYKLLKETTVEYFILTNYKLVKY